MRDFGAAETNLLHERAIRDMQANRRLFIAASAIAPVGCGIPISRDEGIPVAAPMPAPVVRPPQIGQEWRYLERDFFSGKTRGMVVEKISSIGKTITVGRSDEYGSLLPSEIQGPHGMVMTDPHWGKVLNFNPAIPLWPQQMNSNWNKQVFSKYTVSGYPQNKNDWQLYMSAHGWEKITVPAGDFIALRFQNLINFESTDDNKVNCIRRETIWFAPQIGRWVARESSGSYQIQGQIGPVLLESSTKTVLLSWA
jgi:hypothetical protein